MEIIESDVVIIGGGPAGCTCALYTSRSNLKTVILDKNPTIVDPMTIIDIPIQRTMVGGKWSYES